MDHQQRITAYCSANKRFALLMKQHKEAFMNIHHDTTLPPAVQRLCTRVRHLRARFPRRFLSDAAIEKVLDDKQRTQDMNQCNKEQL